VKLLYKKALWVAYTVLENLYNDGYEKLFIFLSEMSPSTFNDKTCSDPALWYEWTECSKKINDAGYLNCDQLFTVLVDYLKTCESEYKCFDDINGDFSSVEVIEKLQQYKINGRWDEILNNSSSY
jgi:hypothetical protein